MKKILYLFFVFPFLFLAGCSSNNGDSFANGSKNEITLTFVQHSYIKHSTDAGYYFKNDSLATTVLSFTNGYSLTQERINQFYDEINHVVPELFGDGYWDYTFFTTDFDLETGLSSKYLEPMILNNSMTIHFAIYG